MHQEALANSPALAAPQAAAATSLTPQAVPPTQTTTPTPSSQVTTAAATSAILPSARLLFRAQVAKAEALVACAAALQMQQEGSASYALPGRDPAVVKHFLAQAGMLVQFQFALFDFTPLCSCAFLCLMVNRSHQPV